MDFYNTLECLEIPDTGSGYQMFAISYGPFLGRGCFSTKTTPTLPTILAFRVPLNGSVMSVQDWIPAEDATREADFLGVARKADPIRLSGCKLTFDDLDTCVGYIYREGGQCDTILSPSVFPVDSLYTAYGYVATCDDNSLKHIYFLQKSTWKWLTRNGKRLALVCTHPGYNGVKP